MTPGHWTSAWCCSVSLVIRVNSQSSPPSTVAGVRLIAASLTTVLRLVTLTLPSVCCVVLARVRVAVVPRGHTARPRHHPVHRVCGHITAVYGGRGDAAGAGVVVSEHPVRLVVEALAVHLVVGDATAVHDNTTVDNLLLLVWIVNIHIVLNVSMYKSRV